LQALLHRRLDPILGFSVAHQIAEETGIATELIDRSERNRIDPLLDRAHTGGRKCGDPVRQRPNEAA
jgi:hypothetical protein